MEKYRSCCNDKGMLDSEDIVGTALYLLSDQSVISQVRTLLLTMDGVCSVKKRF